MDIYEILEERCSQGLKYANAFVNDLCKKYELEPIEVYAEDFQIEDNNRPARFSRDCDGKVYIAYKKLRLICNKDIIESELRHEFRHYWQLIKYPELFLWWMVEHKDLYNDFQNSKDKHGNFLAYNYCPLEIDASAFAINDKVDENILKNANFDEKQWRKILDDNTINN